MDRKKLMMNWDGLAESNEDDLFFDTYARISSAYPLDLHASRSSGTGTGGDDEISDCRLSFASCVSSASHFFPFGNKNNNILDQSAPRTSLSILQDYGVWIAEPPSDITERRRRLLQGMGLMSRKINNNINIINDAGIKKSKSTTSLSSNLDYQLVDSPSPPSASARILLVRSRSDGDIEFYSVDAKKRKEELIGPVSKQRITRTSSVLIATKSALSHHHYANSVRRISEEEKNDNSEEEEKKKKKRSSRRSSLMSNFVQYNGSFFLIKDLDSGKEFVVKESNENGSWNKLSDLETGKQLTLEEFEKYVGFSPVVMELMRRENILPINLHHCRTEEREQQQQQQQPTYLTNSYLSKSFRYSKKRGVALLKNIKEVANSMGGLINADKERESFSSSQQWVKVRHHGKSQKNLTALYSCQEIQAHRGSIWTIKFSSDARYLASAGEDRVIRVWEVQECEIFSPSGDAMDAEHQHQHHHPPLGEISPMHSTDSRKKTWRSFSKKKRSNSMPDYVNLPETVFALCERPVCTFEGHLEDVLDLSWSREHLLLSSSMDKTVRLWDLETETCLKLFAHNDYVTCIQFNPAQDDYFISGSLDSKVRIWNVTHRQVVDWIDLNEMVTAASYTSDGQGAIVGTRKGTCRVYKLDDCRLELKDLIELKKKKKSQVKKVSGIQCSPCFPDEVLITSADSRIRIFDGSENTHKFKGLKNSGSQISASYTPRGKFIVSASEDNHVFIWEREEPKICGGGGGKGRTRIVTNGYEQFHCRDVSVAIPWPGSIKHDPPLVELRSKRHSKRTHSPLSGGTGIASSSIIRDDQNNHSNKREYLPPLPHHTKKTMKRISSFPDQSSRVAPGIGTSSLSSSSSSTMVYKDSPSRSLNSHLVMEDKQRFVSSSTSSSSSSSLLSLFDGGGGGGGHMVHANAWGLVIVTATLGGEIRVYQNFGLPFKVSRRPIPS